MAKPSHQLYIVTRLSASAEVKAAAGRIMAVNLFGGSGATSVKFFDSTDGSGTAVLDINTVIADTRFVDLTEVGGVAFGTAIYATLAGTGGIVEIWYE